MPYEEDQIAALAAGDTQAKADDEARHSGYAIEDAQTAARRERDDVLAQGGVAARAARRLELEQAIKVRDTGQPATADEFAALREQIAKLEAQIMAPKPDSVVVHQPDPIVPIT